MVFRGRERAGERKGIAGLLWGNSNILKLHNGDGYTTVLQDATKPYTSK